MALKQRLKNLQLKIAAAHFISHKTDQAPNNLNVGRLV